jgi:hypothetical protein
MQNRLDARNSEPCVIAVSGAARTAAFAPSPKVGPLETRASSLFFQPGAQGQAQRRQTSARTLRHTSRVERRHQVFVSSTFLDLQAERAAVVSALLQMEAFPAGMELFPATDDDAWTLIRRVIDSSDYYLLVIGGKYGSVDHETEVSYTEKEFDYAVTQGKPVLAFLHADPDKIELGKSEKDNALRMKLEAFRKKVESKKHVKYWSGPDDLAGKVALSFATFRQSYPAPGWIRGDVQTEAESLTEINDLRKQLREVTAQLVASRTLPPAGSEGFAQSGDTMDFQLSAAISVKEVGKQFRRELTQIVTATPTWDKIFSAVGPALLDEVTQRGMRPYLDTALTRSVQGNIRRSVRQWATSNDIELEGAIRVETALSEDDLATILVQLRALGLITRSERRRSVTDKATYWTLTPYGDSHLIALRAISREASGGTQQAGSDDDAATTADAAARQSEVSDDAPDQSKTPRAVDARAADTPSAGKP